MVGPPAPRSTTLGAALLVSAVVTAAIPGFAGFVPPVWLQRDALFLASPVMAAVAFALALTGLLLRRAVQPRNGVFVAAVALLGLNLAAAAYASALWFSAPTCSWGLSGPCFEPFLLCGGGFILDIVAMILVVIGLALAPGLPSPPDAAPPP